ncbi:UDP-N-acetylmuramate dehydrogenase [Nocardioides salsibiostraticola]
MAERLADHTTLRLGGPAEDFAVATTEADLIAAVTAADDAAQPMLLLGGGSNVVIGDEGFDGTVVKIASSGVTPDEAGADATCGGVMVRVAAGEEWDALVASAAARGWVGIEALSGIPGQVGSTPIQNVGAYGQEVSQTIASVRTWDRREGRVRTFANADCDFGYRTSRFKAEPNRYVVLEVVFQFRQGDLGAPVAYAELARSLGIEQGERAPLAQVRDTVLGLRRGKGMVLDADDHDTWSAGSFFTNPIVAAERVPSGAPSWPITGSSEVKTSAAWLIEHAGFAKGYAVTQGSPASLSTKHTLALTNRGDARTQDLLELARAIQDGVSEAYEIRLVNEPVLVGCAL